MVTRVSPRYRYWPWIILGFLIVVAVNLILAIPFLGTLVASLTVSWGISGRRGLLRRSVAFFLWIGGFELVLLGVLMILGIGLVPAFSVAASALFTTSSPLLGVAFVAAGIIAFALGNYVAD